MKFEMSRWKCDEEKYFFITVLWCRVSYLTSAVFDVSCDQGFPYYFPTPLSLSEIFSEGGVHLHGLDSKGLIAKFLGTKCPKTAPKAPFFDCSEKLLLTNAIKSIIEGKWGWKNSGKCFRKVVAAYHPESDFSEKLFVKTAIKSEN